MTADRTLFCWTWPSTSALTALALVVGLAGCATQGPAPVANRESAPVGAAGRPQDHRVIRGDSLYSIAWRYDLDYRQVAAWNGIGPPYRIYAGQDLHLYPPFAAPNPDSRVPPGSDEEAPPRATVTAKKSPVHRSAPRGKHTAVARAPGSHRAVQAASLPQGESVAAQSIRHWIWPTRGPVVQTFASGDRTRQGIRISGNLGQDVVAAESGRVVYSGGELPGYGLLVIIKHDNTYLSAYGFNRKLLVHEGDMVSRGARVAEMGSSADGKPMLHFEIRHGDAVLDPMRLLPHL